MTEQRMTAVHVLIRALHTMGGGIPAGLSVPGLSDAGLMVPSISPAGAMSDECGTEENISAKPTAVVIKMVTID